MTRDILTDADDPTQAWIDGVVTMAALLGVQTEEELAELLPASMPLPRWWSSRQAASTPQARAKATASHVLRLWVDVQETEIKV